MAPEQDDRPSGRDPYDPGTRREPSGKDPLEPSSDAAEHRLDFGEPETVGESEELRYEGPITIDDDAYGTEYAAGSGGRGMLVAALMVVAVIMMLGWALYSRSPAELIPAERQLADRGQGAADEFGRADFDDPAAGVSDDPGLLLDDQPSFADEQPDADDPTVYRPVPRTAPEPEPVREAPTPEPKPQTVRTPTPSPTKPATVQPAATLPAPPESGSLGSMRTLIAQGRLGQAARESRGWARTVVDGRWTLQVMFACQADTVSRAFDSVSDPELMVFPAVAQGRSCYRLTWGTFANRDAALGSAGAVPSYFRNNDRPRPIQLDRAAGL